MIISASYKTDIPAFYGRWFMNRLKAGYCQTVNPYNRKSRRVDLTPEAVDGIVFWTKNIAPFLDHLPAVAVLGIPFVVQYTINDYPRALEHSVVDARRSVAHMKLLAETYGPSAAVWRYDPIIFSSVTPYEAHLRNFAALAEALCGTTDEVVISFAQLYKKTLRNMDAAAREYDFSWEDPEADVKREMARLLAEIASAYGMRLTVCSQRQFTSPTVGEAQCVSSARLTEIGGRPLQARVKGNREECLCSEAVDIGEYDTCPHGCVYCYAVRSQRITQDRFSRHDPDGEFLFAPEPSVLNSHQPHGDAAIQLEML